MPTYYNNLPLILETPPGLDESTLIHLGDKLSPINHDNLRRTNRLPGHKVYPGSLRKVVVVGGHDESPA